MGTLLPQKLTLVRNLDQIAKTDSEYNATQNDEKLPYLHKLTKRKFLVSIFLKVGGI